MLTLAASTAVAVHPSYLFPNYMVTGLEVSCDVNLESSDVVVIVSIVEGRLVVVVGYIEPLRGRQLASDWGYSLVALHRILCQPSYQPLLRCCWHPRQQMMVFPVFPSACPGGIRLEIVYPHYHALEMSLDWIWGLLEHVVRADESDLVVRSDQRLETDGLCLETDSSFSPCPSTYQRKMID